MGIAEDIAKELNDQEEFKSNMTVHQHVDELHSLAEQPDSYECKGETALELCVMSVEGFKKGWRYTLIDREAKDNFSELRDKLERLTTDRKAKYIFRLTVWHDPKRKHDPKTIPPGSLLFSDGVKKLELYNNVAQGSAPLHTIMKVEKSANPTQAKAHKLRKTDQSKDVHTKEANTRESADKELASKTP